MASNRAVKDRTRTDDGFERARKELFEEGISTVADVPRSRTPERRGHHRPDRGRAAIVVHVRRCGDRSPSSTSGRSSACRAPPGTTRGGRSGCPGDRRSRRRRRTGERAGRASGARVVIAIDGPSGAGQEHGRPGARRRLGLEYLDTGAMYRAVTFAVAAARPRPGRRRRRRGGRSARAAGRRRRRHRRRRRRHGRDPRARGHLGGQCGRRQQPGPRRTRPTPARMGGRAGRGGRRRA